MVKNISNMDELQAALMPTMTKLVDKLADEVYKALNYFLLKYYSSYEPKYYNRLFDFLHSAVKVKPKVVGNQVIAYVYIDYDAMDKYRNISGYQVVKWANEGLHGGLNVGNETPYVWDDTLEAVIGSGKLIKDAVQYLRRKGFSVTE